MNMSWNLTRRVRGKENSEENFTALFFISRILETESAREAAATYTKYTPPMLPSDS